MRAVPPGLYAILDDTLGAGLSLAERARMVVEGGARVLQLRLKRTLDPEALEVTRAVVTICREAGALCVVNDRVDLVLLADADGAHVGDEDLPAAEARLLLGERRLLGVTVRDPAGADLARAAGADYGGLGPVFATTSKDVGTPPLGLEEAGRIAWATRLPLVGIGGIGLSNIARVAERNLHGAAVLSDLLGEGGARARALALQREFERGRSRRTLR